MSTLPDTLEIVRFTAGPWAVACLACEVSAASVAPDAPCLEALLHLPEPVATAPGLGLRLRHQNRVIGISGRLELLQARMADLHPLPPLLLARLQLPGGRGLWWPDPLKAPVILLDSTRLEIPDQDGVLPKISA